MSTNIQRFKVTSGFLQYENNFSVEDLLCQIYCETINNARNFKYAKMYDNRTQYDKKNKAGRDWG